MDSGQLQKMKIVAYKKATYEDSEILADGEFNAQVNPENYAMSFKIDYGKDQAPGTSNKLPKYNKTQPLVISFKFIFDGTGALPGTTDAQRENGIMADIDHFKKVTFTYEGEIHRPPFLLLSWGTLFFKCVLTELNLAFKLFRPDGTPVRAEANAKFQGLIDDTLRLAADNKQSPDLTHVRIVHTGDTLPLMCKKIYGDPKYYLEVARYNKLINFRKLKVGQRVEFPPLEKV